jgi:hypothetical protein
MKPEDGFAEAISHSKQFLTLYDLLCDVRQRSARADWTKKFNNLMHWNAAPVVRVDGKERKSILVMQTSLGIDRKRFTHEFLAGLLRAALFSAVAALDRYMHDLVVASSWKLLSRAEEKIPRDLRQLNIPVLRAKAALDKSRHDAKARTGFLVKQAIQNVLHREFTFQKADDVERAAKMAGASDFWRKVARGMPGWRNKENDLKSKLNAIVVRRQSDCSRGGSGTQTEAQKIHTQAHRRILCNGRGEFH